VVESISIKTTKDLLQSDLSSIVDTVLTVGGFYNFGDKCTGSYLVLKNNATESWEGPFLTDGIPLTISSEGELKVNNSYKLVPLLVDGSLNLRLLGLSEKGTVDNEPIFRIAMNHFKDITINGGPFSVSPTYVTPNSGAVFRGDFELKNFVMNQEYILWVKGRGIRFPGRIKFNSSNRRCKNGFIGEDWAGSYIHDISLDSFTYWGMIGHFPYPSNSNAIRIDHSQTNRCGSYLDTTFTTLSVDGNSSILKLADPLPNDINVDRIYSLVAKVNQKLVGSITTGSKVLIVQDKTGIRKTEHITIRGIEDINGNPIKHRVIDIKGNEIYLDKASPYTLTNVDIYLEDHYLPFSGIESGSSFKRISDPTEIQVDCMQLKGMGTNAVGKIRVFYGGGIHIEPGNDNNIWDFGSCHNIANPGISLAEGTMYGHSFQRFESTVCGIAYLSKGWMSSVLGNPYFESNGKNMVIASTRLNLSIYEPVMADKDIYYCYSDKVNPLSTNIVMVNSGTVYSNDFEYVPFLWPNDQPRLTGGKTYLIDYSKPTTDNATLKLRAYTSMPSGRVVRIIIGPNYKSTITFASDDPAYSIEGNTTFVNLSNCEITAYQDHLSFKWKLFINKTAFLLNQSAETTPPIVTSSPVDGSTFTASAINVFLIPNEHATIYYTTDGSMPTRESSVYSGPIRITETTTFKFFGVDIYGNQGVVATSVITKPDVIAPTVTFTPTGGNFYTDNQLITLNTDEKATIYYTLDGSTPTQESTAYNGPIIINETTTLKFFGKDIAGNESTVQSVTFTKVVDEKAPSAVEGLNKIDATDSTVLVGWTQHSDPGIAGYNIYVNNTKQNETLIDPTKISYELTDLTEGTEYLIEVTAVDNATNESARSGLMITTPTVVVIDSFNRADGPIGTTETGQAWNTGASSYLVSSNQVYLSNGSDPALISHNLKNFMYYITLSREHVGNYFIRYTDSQNSLFLQNSGGKYHIIKKVNNKQSLIFSSTITDNNGDQIKITHRNDGFIKATVRGELIWEGIVTDHLETFNSSGFSGNSATRFDDFKITTLG